MCCCFVTYLDNLVKYYARQFGTDTKRFKQREIGCFKIKTEGYFGTDTKMYELRVIVFSYYDKV